MTTNQILYTIRKTNTTKDVEFWNPFTNQYEDSNPILNVPAGSYSGLKARLKGSDPSIIATYSGTITVVDGVVMSGYSAVLAGDSTSTDDYAANTGLYYKAALDKSLTDNGISATFDALIRKGISGQGLQFDNGSTSVGGGFIGHFAQQGAGLYVANKFNIFILQCLLNTLAYEVQFGGGENGAAQRTYNYVKQAVTLILNDNANWKILLPTATPRTNGQQPGQENQRHTLNNLLLAGVASGDLPNCFIYDIGGDSRLEYPGPNSDGSPSGIYGDYVHFTNSTVQNIIANYVTSAASKAIAGSTQIRTYKAPYEYHKKSFVQSDLDKFTAVGSMNAVINNGEIQLTTSAVGSFIPQLRLKSIAQVEQLSAVIRIRVNSINNTSYGMGIGIQSANPNGQGSVASILSTTPAGTTPLIFTQNQGTINGEYTKRAEGLQKFYPAVGDILELAYEFNTLTSTCTISSATNKPVSVTLNHSITPNDVTNPPNMGQVALYLLGGSYSIIELHITSADAAKARLAILGTSKINGYDAGSYSNRIVNKLSTYYNQPVLNQGSGSDTSSDFVSRISRVMDLGPEIVVISDDSNSLRFGQSLAQQQANRVQITNLLKNMGIKVYHSQIMPETSGLDFTPFNTWLANTYGNDYFTVPTPVTSDGVHPNPASQQGQFDAIKNKVGTLAAGTAPIISSITNTVVYPNSQVVVTGINLANTTLVKYGQIPTTFTQDSPTQVTVIVPSTATCSATIHLETSIGTCLSPTLVKFNTTAIAPTITRVETFSDSPNRTYAGTWTDSVDSVYANGKGKYNLGIDEYYGESAYCTSIEVWSPKVAGGGSFEIQIDNVPITPIYSIYSANAQNSQLIATVSGLSPGVHKITCQNKGGGSDNVLLSDKLVFITEQ